MLYTDAQDKPTLIPNSIQEKKINEITKLF